MLRALAICAIPLLALPESVWGTPPAPDHVVIVIEENHSLDQVMGSMNAPYLNGLARTGASFSNFYAITHPSQPNYLQFFSGSNQGVPGDAVPAPGSPFSTPNMASEILAVGKTFGGYADDLPGIGATDDYAANGDYVRRHNPWVNWQADPPGPNQLPPALNMPMTSFPSDFSKLPTVSIVVPNLQHDMHDGSIAEADSWVQSNLGPYAAWAQTHNSMLIVTWDEDNFSSKNHIPTIISGPMVKAGQIDTTWTLHNLLRTVEDMYGASHAGAAAQVQPIAGAFTTDVSTATRVFRQGGGYDSVHDTFLQKDAPAAAHGGDAAIVVDGTPASQALLRFDNIIGGAASQVPPGANVLSAKLTIQTSTGAAGDTSKSTMSLYPLLRSWTDSSTWDSLGDGIAPDGVEAKAAPDFSLEPSVNNGKAVFDVTSTVRQWVQTPSGNLGWAIETADDDGWRWWSSETDTVADRPALEITWAAPPPWQNPLGPLDVNADGSIGAADASAVIEYIGQHGIGPLSSTGPGANPLYVDATGDGVIGPADAQVILNYLGFPPLQAPGDSTPINLVRPAVPEPSGAVLAAMGCLGLVVAKIARRKAIVV